MESKTDRVREQCQETDGPDKRQRVDGAKPVSFDRIPSPSKFYYVPHVVPTQDNSDEGDSVSFRTKYRPWLISGGNLFPIGYDANSEEDLYVEESAIDWSKLNELVEGERIMALYSIRILDRGKHVLDIEFVFRVSSWDPEQETMGFSFQKYILPISGQVYRMRHESVLEHGLGISDEVYTDERGILRAIIREHESTLLALRERILLRTAKKPLDNSDILR